MEQFRESQARLGKITTPDCANTSEVRLDGQILFFFFACLFCDRTSLLFSAILTLTM